MDKWKQILRVMTGIFVTVTIAVLAFFLPKWLFDVHDSRVFGKQEQVKLEIANYEKKEGSLEEQLRSIGLCNKYGEFTISAVRMDEEAAALSDGEVAQIVFQEIDKLLDFEMLMEHEHLREAALVGRELYTAYITSPFDSEYAARDAITFWKLCYQWNEEGQPYTLEVILDMEYHKLYDIKIWGDVYTGIYTKYDGMPSKKRKSVMELDEWVRFVEDMMSYYGILDKTYIVDAFYDVKEMGSEDMDDANVSGLYPENRAGISKEVAGETSGLLYRMVGYTQFLQDTDKEDPVLLLLVKEYGMDGEQGFVHISIGSMAELLKLR